MSDPRSVLHALFAAAVASADPAKRIRLFLPDPPKGRTIVVGCGKAAASMARAFEESWPGPLEGLGDGIVTGPTLTNVNDFRAVLITERTGTRQSDDGETSSTDTNR